MRAVQQEFLPFREEGELKHRGRKNHNQYFTPEFAIEKAFSLIPKVNVKNIIDPAVGEGAFLKIASKVWGGANLFGIDIDPNIITDLSKSNLPNSFFICGDSLSPKIWHNLPELQDVLSPSGFDLAVGNPPFSSWFNRIISPEILKEFCLSMKNGRRMKSQAIEILFLETFIRLAKSHGFIIIVLPDGILSNPQYKYVREFILKETLVKNIISLPRNVFENTSAKTSILILQKKRIKELDYLAKISDLAKSGVVNNTVEVSGKDLVNRMDYYYYHNSRDNRINDLRRCGTVFRPLKDFIIFCKTGKTHYGKDRKFSKKGLRFLHATNITEVGINYAKDEKFIDPTSKMNFPNAYAKIGDILFVRVGVGCAGRVAIVGAKEDEGVATDYIHVFKVKGINPYFLAIYLKTKFGKDSINLLKHGVGTVSINKTDLLSIPIPIVSETIQHEVEKRYKNILTEYRITPGVNNSNINIKMEDLIYDVEQNLQKGKV